MLDSKYAKYVKERTNDSIIENQYGFATYRYLDDGKVVYIVDIYVDNHIRRDGHAKALADKICKEAKEKGAQYLIGTVAPSAKNSTVSMKVLMAYGMTLHSAQNDCIIFRKEL